MILTKPYTKTEAELFSDKVLERETLKGIKIPYRILELSMDGKIKSIETDNPDLIAWLQTKGFN